MYETRLHRPLTRPQFLRRLVWHFLFAQTFVFCSLLIGMAGYEYYEKLAWRDAFLNAAMLLGGMGPVESPQTPGGKIFAGLYALYAGLVVIIVAGVLFAPVLHRMMHKFHWQPDKSS
jgi:ABC-type glycerol-3-phosphate transport system permease component